MAFSGDLLLNRTWLKALSAIALIMMTMPAHAQPLDSYHWQYRPLLVFTPGDDNALSRDWIKAVENHAEGFKDRDMILVKIAADQPAVTVTDFQQAKPPQPATKSTQNFYVHYNVSLDTPALILVGKDGTEKGRWHEDVAMEEIFTLIDSMPMRKREMRK